MRTFLAGLLLGAVCAAAGAEEKQQTYVGTWLTTNRPLDGTMTCVVTDLGNQQWRGHFYGVWQGVEFSYRVEFSGPPERLQGRAVIDGADYVWSGKMGREFKGTFTGNRYNGSFKLKKK